MGQRKAYLLLYFLFFLHLRHHFLQAISLSTTDSTSVQVQTVESKPDDDEFAGNLRESAVVVIKGSLRGRGGGSFGGGGRSFGGGGRGGSRGGSGDRGRTRGGGGGSRVFPFIGGGLHHGGHRSSGGRESGSVWLGFSALVGLVFVF